MTKDLLIAMLNKGETGNEILKILNAIASDDSGTTMKEPTSEPIDF